MFSDIGLVISFLGMISAFNFVYLYLTRNAGLVFIYGFSNIMMRIALL